MGQFFAIYVPAVIGTCYLLVKILNWWASGW